MVESTSNFPNAWEEVGHTTPVEELPIVHGRLAKDGTVRVDEDALEPGRYRVAFQGEIVGEVKVTDPVVARKSNRKERRRDRQLQRYRMPSHPLAGLNRRSR